MFLLITPVHRFNFEPTEPWKIRREEAIRKYFDRRPDNLGFDDGYQNSLSFQLAGGMTTREALLHNYMVATYERRSQNPGINNDDLEELYVEKGDDVLHINVCGTQYLPSSTLEGKDRLETLNKEFEIISIKIMSGEVEVKEVSCNLSRVEHMNQRGIATLFSFHNTLKGFGVAVEFCGLNPKLAKQLNSILKKVSQ